MSGGEIEQPFAAPSFHWEREANESDEAGMVFASRVSDLGDVEEVSS